MCWRRTQWSCIFIFQGGNLRTSNWRPQQMVGKPGGNPCRPQCVFEVALQAAATGGWGGGGGGGGAKYGTVASSAQKTLTHKSKHSRRRPEAKLLCRLSPKHTRGQATFALRSWESRNAESNHTRVHSSVRFWRWQISAVPVCLTASPTQIIREKWNDHLKSRFFSTISASSANGLKADSPSLQWQRCCGACPHVTEAQMDKPVREKKKGSSDKICLDVSLGAPLFGPVASSTTCWK